MKLSLKLLSLLFLKMFKKHNRLKKSLPKVLLKLKSITMVDTIIITSVVPESPETKTTCLVKRRSENLENLVLKKVLLRKIPKVLKELNNNNKSKDLPVSLVVLARTDLLRLKVALTLMDGTLLSLPLAIILTVTSQELPIRIVLLVMPTARTDVLSIPKTESLTIRKRNSTFAERRTPLVLPPKHLLNSNNNKNLPPRTTEQRSFVV